MPPVLQRCRAALAAQPRGVRLFLLGALAFVCVLAGGALTAYGGLILVVWMWALCMGGLCLLLNTTWKIAFPGEGPFWKDKPFPVSYTHLDVYKRQDPAVPPAAGI